MKKLDRYLSIFALVVVAGTPLLNKPVIATEAALTAPASYDHAYKYDATYGGFLAFQGLTSQGSSVFFTRTTNSTYFDYTVTTDADDKWPFNISMTFKRSNTAWTVSPYEPDDTKIGNDNSTGGQADKLYFHFNNQTKDDYKLYMDYSDSPQSFVITYDNGLNPSTFPLMYYASSTTNFYEFYIPAFTQLRLGRVTTSAASYFSGWYLDNLGTNAAYDEGRYDGIEEGYDEGYEDGYNNSLSPLWDGLEVAVGVTLNFILFIATLSIFDISLLNIGIVLVSILGLVWVLKALRG
jgi:hypothetical protein